MMSSNERRGRERNPPDSGGERRQPTASRWGPSSNKRSLDVEERPAERRQRPRHYAREQQQQQQRQRGYSIGKPSNNNERNIRRRVDADLDGSSRHSEYGRGRSEHDYYGRGYDEKRPPPPHWDDRGYQDERRPPPYCFNDYEYEEERQQFKEEYHDGDRFSHHPQEEEWRCAECGIYNYGTDARCARCGTRPRTTQKSRSKQGPRGVGGGGSGDDSDAKRSAAADAKPSFPPPFESGGAAYDFHSASGMFYESIADFFYDPKTKLYYSNKEKIYYNYCPGQDPPFCALAPPPTSDQGGAADVAPADSAASKPEDKKKIAISLKTTVLPGEGNAAKKPTAAKTPKKAKTAQVTTAQPKKKDAANMEVWTERGKESRKTQNVVMTTTNKPVCMLCRRKFPSIEKLRKHEELSDLHKENLEKKLEEEEAKKANMDYRDRALERRLMHGPEAAATQLPVAAAQETRTPKTDVVRPEDNLGESNIGNKMLQKLGWKSGSSLGRDTSATEEDKVRVQSSLVKDWQKIESMAASGQAYDRKEPSSRGGGMGN